MPRWNWCPISQYYYHRVDEAGVITETPFPCKSWECPYCGTRKYNKLRPLLELAFQSFSMEGYTWPYHVTLTMNPSRISRKQAWATLGKRFDDLRRGLQRDAGQVSPIYTRVVAQNKETGYPHVHLLILFQPAHTGLSLNKLRNRLEELWKPKTGGGFVRVVKVDEMEGIPKKVGYIMRDLRKPLPFLPKRGRRVSVSKDIRFWDQEGNYKPPPKTDKAGGKRKRGNILESAARLKAQGYHVTLGGRGLIAKPPPRA